MDGGGRGLTRGRWRVVARGAALGIFVVASNPAIHLAGQAITPNSPRFRGGTLASYLVRQVDSAPSGRVSNMSTNMDVGSEIGNKQVLVGTFLNLVRYAVLKTHRAVVKLGVTPSNFSVEAMDRSLAARANAGLFGDETAPSVKALLTKAHEPSSTFQFYWTASTVRDPLEAAFALSYEPDGDLKVRLLWLGLPERVPISPRTGAVGGLKPLEEAVQELLRVLEHGRLVPYPPPR